ncbi:predicted protein [Arabidopsis lyrata subsp. lyrata]|uniref:Predicted protein n=1 Tax=Arabidopsis lyrata subsp. lyrata TaxID=81972 RepID=D7KS74_ARALL|nr:predicted protein [Arabidopsis lyrata subsp. lyrata]
MATKLHSQHSCFDGVHCFCLLGFCFFTISISLRLSVVARIRILQTSRERRLESS